MDFSITSIGIFQNILPRRNPCSSYLEGKIVSLACETIQLNSIIENQQLSISSDGWSTNNLKAFYANSITCHFVDKDWVLKHVVLDVSELGGRTWLNIGPRKYWTGIWIETKSVGWLLMEQPTRILYPISVVPQPLPKTQFEKLSSDILDGVMV